MKTFIISSLIAFVVSQCGKQTLEPEVDGASMIIRSGTSYGFCIGYCQRELTLIGTSAQYVMRDNRKELPEKTCSGTISGEEWNALTSKVNFTTFQQQPERIGCPDCADGGAEFVEIESGGKKYRVTFEANKTIPGFDELVLALRKKREAFKDCQ